MADRTANLRILDAASNRAAEGLGVVEDFIRFALDDPFLTRLAEEIRHDLAALAAGLSPPATLATRDTQHDMGTKLSPPSGQSRSDLTAVCSANLRRIEEALRSIEEYSKLMDVSRAAGAMQLRNRTDTLERCIGVHLESTHRLSNARLYVLVDGRGSDEEFTSDIELLVDAGADLLQLRDKRLTDRQLLDRAHRLVAATRGTETLAIVNDRPDVAAASRADGVHVGQDELPVEAARSIVGPDALVGVSTHSASQIEAALRDGANYLGVGPVYASGTKNFDALPGLPLVSEASTLTSLPWFAIGGITQSNVSTVLAAGATRVAVCAAVANAEDPLATVREFKRDLC